jgi:MFS family permease
LAHAQQITIPALINYYHLTTGQQAWVSAAQGIPAGSFLLLFGRLADIFGRKRVLLVALVSHALGGVVCGASFHMYVHRNSLILDIFSISVEQCRVSLVLALFPLASAFLPHYTPLAAEKTESLQLSARHNPSAAQLVQCTPLSQ